MKKLNLNVKEVKTRELTAEEATQANGGIITYSSGTYSAYSTFYWTIAGGLRYPAPPIGTGG